MTTKPEPTVKGLNVTSTSTAVTTVQILTTSGTVMILSYATMPGNAPSTNNNTVFLWQSHDAVLYKQTPISSAPVPGATQSGSMAMSNIVLQPNTAYTIGYAVGGTAANVCSWSSISADGKIDNFSSQVWAPPDGISPNAVLVSYLTPIGNQPQAGAQWVGIWMGVSVPYTGAPISQQLITSNAESGQQALLVQLARGTTYTIGYFMGTAQTTLAASFTFTTTS